LFSLLVNLKTESDENLVVNYQNTKNNLVVGELFKRHSLMCFTVCVKYLRDEDAAHDATMNIFEKLFNDLQKHQINNFKSWLHTVCKNHCLILLRKPNVLVSINEDEEENENLFMQLSNILNHDDDKQEKEEKLQAVENAILGLKDKQKQCIELFYLKQKSYVEIADITGYTENEVKSYIQNGKRNLKIILEQKGITIGLALFLWIQIRA
jgi:RNA polymerase sigma factor (sigma-70 family)